MTDENLSTGLDVSNESSSTPVDNVASSDNDSQTSESTQQEKMLSQSEVNEIVGRAKRAAHQKGYERATKESVQSHTASEPNIPNHTQSQSSFGGMAQTNEADIRRLINEESQRAAFQAQADRVAREFVGKMTDNSVKERYPDFDEVVGAVDLTRMPHVVDLANTFENTADIMYELAKNPSKLAAIQILNDQPGLAKRSMKQLSDSIRKNNEAANQKTPNAPLSQIRSSTTGSDNGSMTVRDYKKADWLRG